MQGYTGSPGLSPPRIAAAAACLLPFVALYALLNAWQPPDAGQLQVADPLVQGLLPIAGTWTIAFIATAIAAAWLHAFRPPARDLRHAACFAALGAVAGLLLPLLIRWLHGDTLPAFIPPEESAAPGMTAGIGAGVIEEALFRLGLLPLAFFALRRHAGLFVAATGACVITGLGFALSHELVPAAGGFEAAHFATRVLIPGMAMSALAILLHPAFIISAHCSAHVALALLFMPAMPG